MSEIESKLENLADSAAQESGGATFMDPTQKPAKKRGRPKKVREPEAEPQVLPPPQSKEERVASLLPITVPLTRIISSVGEKVSEDPEGAMSPDEIDGCARAMAGCLDRYMPNLFSEHADAVVLIMILGSYSFKVYNLRAQNLEKLRREYAAKQTQAVATVQ